VHPKFAFFVQSYTLVLAKQLLNEGYKHAWDRSTIQFSYKQIRGLNNIFYLYSEAGTHIDWWLENNSVNIVLAVTSHHIIYSLIKIMHILWMRISVVSWQWTQCNQSTTRREKLVNVQYWRQIVTEFQSDNSHCTNINITDSTVSKQTETVDMPNADSAHMQYWYEELENKLLGSNLLLNN